MRQCVRRQADCSTFLKETYTQGACACTRSTVKEVHQGGNATARTWLAAVDGLPLQQVQAHEGREDGRRAQGHVSIPVAAWKHTQGETMSVMWPTVCTTTVLGHSLCSLLRVTARASNQQQCCACAERVTMQDSATPLKQC